MLAEEYEDKVVESLEQLRIHYNTRQYRVCALICETLADAFKDMADTKNASIAMEVPRKVAVKSSLASVPPRPDNRHRGD